LPPSWGIPTNSDPTESPVTTTTDSKSTAAAFAPGVLAIVATVVGLFVPFIGLPIAMVAVVAIAAANIRDRRVLYATIGIVAASIVINLVLVMMALPAGRELVQGV
jgi:hypothetical protein